KNILNCDDQTPVLYLKRVRYVENEKVILIENWINMDICINIDLENFEVYTLFDMIEKTSGKKIEYGIRSFEARSTTKEQAENLSIEINTPVLFLDQKTFVDDDQIIEYSNVLLRSDKHKIVSILER